MSEATRELYLQSDLEVTNEFIYDRTHEQIIDHSERDLIYKESADIICQNGGKILQVGFRMGSLAHFIQRHSTLLESHDIIEEHPDIISYAESVGYSQNLLAGDWRNWVQKMIENDVKYDAIYFTGHYVNECETCEFNMYVDKILKPGGIYMFDTLCHDAWKMPTRWSLDEHEYLPRIKYIKRTDCVDFNDGIFHSFKDVLLQMSHGITWFTKPLNKKE